MVTTYLNPRVTANQRTMRQPGAGASVDHAPATIAQNAPGAGAGASQLGDSGLAKDTARALLDRKARTNQPRPDDPLSPLRDPKHASARRDDAVLVRRHRDEHFTRLRVAAANGRCDDVLRLSGAAQLGRVYADYSRHCLESLGQSDAGVADGHHRFIRDELAWLRQQTDTTGDLYELKGAMRGALRDFALQLEAVQQPGSSPAALEAAAARSLEATPPSTAS